MIIAIVCLIDIKLFHETDTERERLIELECDLNREITA